MYAGNSCILVPELPLSFPLLYHCTELVAEGVDNMHFVKENVLKEDTKSQQLIDAITRPNSLVIYDGDDHLKEIQTYMPHQMAGSVFVSHDFGDRILTSWIEESLTANNFTELFSTFATHLSTHLRAFKRVA